MKDSILKLIELQQPNTEAILNSTIQQTITIWLSSQLNTPTNDACAKLSAQAFKINTCQTAAHKV